jgi:hypothetical protein
MSLPMFILSEIFNCLPPMPAAAPAFSNFHLLAFRWRQDREGWLEAAELAEAVARSGASEGTKFQYLERNGRVNVIFATDRAGLTPSNPPA